MPMYKVVGFVKKRKDISFEEFKEYWLKQHNKLEQGAVKERHVRKILASFVVPELSPEDRPFDGMVELYFHSLEEMKEQMAGPQPKIMLEDEKNFVDINDGRVFVVTQEYTMAEKTPRLNEI